MTDTGGTVVQQAAPTGSALVDHHNDILERAEVRALELEGKLVAILQPILDQAGQDAAAAFEQKATNHLTAAALWSNDVQQLAALPEKLRRPTIASLALTAAAPARSSVMVCLKPRPEEAAELVLDGGEPAEQIHVTLALLGEIPADVDLDFIVDALRTVAGSHAPLEGEVGGVGAFGDNGKGSPMIALPSVPGLVELRVAVTEALTAAQITYGRRYGYLPHLTLDYDESRSRFPPRTDIGQPLHFDELYVVRGDVEVIPLPLTGAPAQVLTAAGEPPGWTSPAGDELIDVKSLVQTLRTKTDPVRQAVVETMVRGTLEGTGVDFDVTNPLVAKLMAQTGSQITNIADTTQLNVMRVIRESYDQGLSIPDTAEAIRAGMSSASEYRATMIARTELAGAVNGGSLAATEIASEATGVGFKKVWMTAPGAKYPRHEDYDGLNGQTVALDQPFDVGGDELMHPGDPAGSPGEVINCRCTMSYTEGEGRDRVEPVYGPDQPVPEGLLVPTDGPFPTAGLNLDGRPVQADGISVPGQEPLAPLTIETINEFGLTKFPPDPGATAERLFGSAGDTEHLYTEKTPDGKVKFDENGKPVYLAERKAFHEWVFTRLFKDRKLGSPCGDGGRPLALFTSGGGASGKGGSLFEVCGEKISVNQITGDVEKGIPPDLRFVHIDPDMIKGLMGEYKQMIADGDVYAASGVHEESSYLAKEVTEMARLRGYNILLDTTGQGNGVVGEDKFVKKILEFKDAGYDVQVTASTVDTNIALDRMVIRGKDKGRYVAEPALKEAHAMSAQSFLAWRELDWISEWRLYDNTGAKELIAEARNGIIDVKNEELYQRYLAKRFELKPPKVEKIITTERAEPVPTGLTSPAPPNVELPSPGPPPVATPASSLVEEVKLGRPDGGPEIRESLNAIDQVHGVDGIQWGPIPVVAKADISEEGRITGARLVSHREGSMTFPDRIEVDPNGTNIELDFAHEFGHALDYSLPGQQKEQILKAIKGSEAWRKLSTRTDDFAEYAGRDREGFARAYAQWVAERSDSVAMKGQVARKVEDAAKFDRLPLQWAAEDFAPIGEAFDKTFADLGWRRSAELPSPAPPPALPRLELKPALPPGTTAADLSKGMHALTGDLKKLTTPQVKKRANDVVASFRRYYHLDGDVKAYYEPDVTDAWETDARTVRTGELRVPLNDSSAAQEIWYGRKILDTARDPEMGVMPFRQISHEAGHTINPASTLPGFAHDLEEGGAEILSLRYWQDVGQEFDARDAVRVNGRWTAPGIESLANSVVYRENVLDVMRRAASKVGWDRNAITDEVLQAMKGDHYARLDWQKATDGAFPLPAGATDAPSLMEWYLREPEGGGVDIGITPFREGKDNPLGFYESERWHLFLDDVNGYAPRYGVTVDSIDRVTGVWPTEGVAGSEPSMALKAHDGELAMTAYAADLAKKYEQYGVLLFDSRGTDGVMATFTKTFTEAEHEQVVKEIGDAGLHGGRFTPEGLLQVTGEGPEFVASLDRLAASLNSTYDASNGRFRLLEDHKGHYTEARDKYAAHLSDTGQPPLVELVPHDPAADLPGVLHPGPRGASTGEAAAQPPRVEPPSPAPPTAGPTHPSDLPDFTAPAPLVPIDAVTPETLAPQLLAQAELMGPVVTPGLEALVLREGGTMKGLNRAIKGEPRLIEKIQTDAAEKMIDPEAAADRVYDSLRYTAIFAPEDLAAGAARTMADLERAGMKVDRLKNFWTSGDGTYQGINVVMKAPNGYAFELQFHTEASFLVKGKINHPFYEELRVLKLDIKDAGGATEAQAARIEELKAIMRKNQEQVIRPAGIEHLRALPELPPLALRALQPPTAAQMHTFVGETKTVELAGRQVETGTFAYEADQRKLEEFLARGNPIYVDSLLPDVAHWSDGLAQQQKVEVMRRLGKTLADDPVWQAALGPIPVPVAELRAGELFLAPNEEANPWALSLHRVKADGRIEVHAGSKGWLDAKYPTAPVERVEVTAVSDLKEGQLFRRIWEPDSPNVVWRVNKTGNPPTVSELNPMEMAGEGSTGTRLYPDSGVPFVQVVQPNDVWRLPLGPASIAGEARLEADVTLSEGKASGVVANWAGTSADDNPWALAVQRAAFNEFNLDPSALRVFDDRSPTALKNTVSIVADKGPAFQAAARAMYEETQRQLAAKGIKRLTLYRGVKAIGVTAREVDPSALVHLQPASSFSATYDIARRFAGGDGAVMAIDVPAERVLSMSGTGFGCLNETEFVVLGRALDAPVDRAAMIAVKQASELPSTVAEFWAQVARRDQPVEVAGVTHKVGSSRVAAKLQPGQLGQLGRPDEPAAAVFKSLGVDENGKQVIEVVGPANPAAAKETLWKPGEVLRLQPDERYYPLWQAASREFAGVPTRLPDLVDDTPQVMAAALREQAQVMEPVVTEGLRTIATSLGGTMQGLDFRVKGSGSLLRKITGDAAEKQIEPLKAAEDIKDVLRYTAIFSEADYTAGVDKMLAAIEKAGLHVERLKNFWRDGDGTYVGINTVVHTPNGYQFELQFHTERSMLVKEKYLHPEYEKLRVEGLTADEIEAIKEKMRYHTSTGPHPVPHPAGVDRIEVIPAPEPMLSPGPPTRPLPALKAPDPEAMTAPVGPVIEHPVLGPAHIEGAPAVVTEFPQPVYAAEQRRLQTLLVGADRVGPYGERPDEMIGSTNLGETIKKETMDVLTAKLEELPVFKAALGPEPVGFYDAPVGTVFVQGDVYHGMKLLRVEEPHVAANGHRTSMASGYKFGEGWTEPRGVSTNPDSALAHVDAKIEPLDVADIQTLKVGDKFRMLDGSEGQRVFQYEGMETPEMMRSAGRDPMLDADEAVPLYSEPGAVAADGRPYRFTLSTVSGDMVGRVAEGDVWRLPNVGTFGKTPAENRVANLVHSWATSSADHNAWSIALQKAAQQELHLDPQSLSVFDDRTAYSRTGSDAIMAEKGPVLRAYVRAMYEETQQRLRTAGIHEVTLYRGVRGMPNTSPIIDPHGPMPLQPASSFSADYQMAENFASSDGAVYAVTVPAERILAFPGTGWGCLSESEFVVLAPTEGGAADVAAVFAPGQQVTGHLPGSVEMFWKAMGAPEKLTADLDRVAKLPKDSMFESTVGEMAVGDHASFHLVHAGVGKTNDIVFKKVGVDDNGQNVLEVIRPVNPVDTGTAPHGTIFKQEPGMKVYRTSKHLALEPSPAPPPAPVAVAPLKSPPAAEMTAVAHDDVPVYQAEQTKLETFLARGARVVDDSPEGNKVAQAQKETTMRALAASLDENPVWRAAAPTQRVMEIEKMPVGTFFVDPESRTQLYRYDGPGEVKGMRGETLHAPHTYREMLYDGRWGEARPLEQGAPKGANVFGLGRRGSVGEVTPIVSLDDLKVGDLFRPAGAEGAMLQIMRFDEEGRPVVKDLAFPEKGARPYDSERLVEPMRPDDQIWRMPPSAYVDAKTATESEARAAGVVDGWAATSADHSHWAVATQKAVAEEFGLDTKAVDLYADRPETVQAADSVMADKGLALRAAVRAMYDETQRQLAAAGIDELTLYRGVKKVEAALGKEVESNATIHLQPMSAFSADYKTARLFAGDDGSVMAVRVPRERVLSMSGTGFGCLHESEFVVLSPAKAAPPDHAAMIAARSYADIPPTADVFWAEVAARDKPIAHAGRLHTVGPKQPLSETKPGDIVTLDRPGTKGAALLQVLGHDEKGWGVVVVLDRADPADTSKVLWEKGQVLKLDPADTYYPLIEPLPVAGPAELKAAQEPIETITDGPATEHLDEHYADWGKEIPLYQKHALEGWQSGYGHKEIATYLRGGTDAWAEQYAKGWTADQIENGVKALKSHIGNIDEAIEAAPVTAQGLETIVFRGLQYLDRALPADYRVGTVVSEPNFTAVSTEQSVAERYIDVDRPGDHPGIFRVELPPGEKGAWLPAAGLEKVPTDVPLAVRPKPNFELLLSRDRKFVVTKVETTTVYGKQVPLVTMRPYVPEAVLPAPVAPVLAPKAEAIAPVGELKHVHLERVEVIPEKMQLNLDHLREVPANVAAALEDAGVEFYVGPGAVPTLDDLGQWAGVRPQGWPAGSTWDSVAGAYYERTNVVAIGASGRDGSLSIALHETGHAIERKLLDVSTREELFAFHKRLHAALSPYYKQGGPGGVQGSRELFAETYAAYETGGIAAVEDFLDVPYLEQLGSPAATKRAAAAREYAQWLDKTIKGIK